MSTGIAKLIGQVVRATAAAAGLTARPPRRPVRLLFAFNGRSQHWAGMGRELYAREPAFRAAVRRYDDALRQVVGLSILPHFEEAAPDAFAASRMRYGMTAIQIALVELWKANGVEPEAVLGMSLGEVTAVYAAGGLTLPDVVRICASSTLIYELEQKAFITLLLPVGLGSAQAFCASCPVGLYPVYQAGPQAVVAVCHFQHQAAAGEFLTGQGLAWRLMDAHTYWPNHTPLIERHRGVLLRHLQAIAPQPLHRPFYSACRGQLIAAGTTLAPDFWYEVLRQPVLLYPALEAALTAEFTAIVHIGTHPFLRGQLQSTVFAVDEQTRLFDSMRKGSPEVAAFHLSRHQLRRLGQ